MKKVSGLNIANLLVEKTFDSVGIQAGDIYGIFT